MSLYQDEGKVISLNLKLNLSIVNALWVLLTGEKLPLEDPKLKMVVSKLDKLLRLETRDSPLQQIIRFISPTLSKYVDKGFMKFNDIFQDIFALVRIHLNDHKEVLDQDNPKDFMDVYLTEMGRTTDPTSSFYGQRGEESLMATMADLFLAGKLSYLLLLAFYTLCMHVQLSFCAY